jgi:hypothetical protein
MTRRLLRQALSAFTTLVSTCVFITATQAQGGPPTVDVNVVNGAENPVPVTGSLETTGTITGEVTVGNDPDTAIPVTVQNAAEQIKHTFTLIVSNPDTDDTSPPFDVPDGSRLFIDGVACRSLSPATEAVVSLALTVDAPNLTFMPIVNRRSQNLIFEAYQQMSSFVDHDVQASVILDSAPVQMIIHCDMWGRLVDLE